METLIQSVLSNQSTLNEWKNDFNSEQWKQANELHFKLFKSHLNQTKNCGCLNDFYIALNSKHKIKNIMEKENRQFIIKSGALIMLHKEVKQFSEHSSEEDCIYLLSKYPAQIVNFERYPANWEEIVNAGALTSEENPRKAELESLKVNELKEIIVSMELEVPEGKKAELVQFILDNEAEA